MSKKDLIDSVDFGKAEELRYQVSELTYHLTYYHLSLQEATDHLKRAEKHIQMIKDLNSEGV